MINPKTNYIVKDKLFERINEYTRHNAIYAMEKRRSKRVDIMRFIF
jgi:hypothetical protein